MDAPARGPTTAFLIRHEVRLWVRRIFDGRRSARTYVTVLGSATLVLHLIAFVIVRALDRLPGDLAPTLILPLLSMAVATMLTLITAQALSGATRAFFDSGVTDVLLTAPIAPRRLFVVRAVALAVTTSAPFAVFVLPLANVGLFIGGPRWLAIYPTFVAVSLVGTALGLVLALQLVNVLGVRLSRSAGQIVAVLIGTSLGFAIQQFNRMPMEGKLDLIRRTMDASARAGDGWGLLVWSPGLALAGNPLAVLILGVLALVVFTALVSLTAGRYVRARQESAGMVDRAGRGRDRANRFHADPMTALRNKEWRLLTRDPWILMPVLQRAIALVPLCLMLSAVESATSDSTAAAVAPMLVVFAGKLAGGIAWLTLAAEEAPELVGTAPVSAARVRRAKLEAALAASGFLFCLPLGLLAWRSPEAAFFAFLGCAAATITATLLALAEPSAGRRRSFHDRFRNSISFVMAELLATLGLAGAVWLAVIHEGLPAAMVAAASIFVVMIFVAVMRPVEKTREEGAAPLPAADPQALSRNPS